MALNSRTIVNNGELCLCYGAAKSCLNLDPLRIANGNLGIVAEPLKQGRRQLNWRKFYALGLLTNTWPELDILEILGDNPQKLYFLGIAMWGGAHSSESKPIEVPDTSAEFHTYAVDWTKGTINCFFDVIQVASKPTPEEFHQLMYMLRNPAVAGSWPGAPDTTTEFAAKCSIDWVRAYAKKPVVAGSGI